MRRPHYIFAVLIIGLAAVLVAPHLASACPTCKEGMDANDPEHAGMVKGYFYSILFMMSMPYILFSAFGLYMWREVKKARQRKEAEAQAATLTETDAANSMSRGNPMPAETEELLEV